DMRALTCTGLAIATPGASFISPGFTTDCAGNVAITSGVALAAGGHALSITATQPASPVAAQNAVLVNITGAGSASQNNNAISVAYTTGYTGSSRTAAVAISNSNAGTGNTLIPAARSNVSIGTFSQQSST